MYAKSNKTYLGALDGFVGEREREVLVLAWWPGLVVITTSALSKPVALYKQLDPSSVAWQ